MTCVLVAGLVMLAFAFFFQQKQSHIDQGRSILLAAVLTAHGVPICLSLGHIDGMGFMQKFSKKPGGIMVLLNLLLFAGFPLCTMFQNNDEYLLVCLFNVCLGNKEIDKFPGTCKHIFWKWFILCYIDILQQRVGENKQQPINSSCGTYGYGKLSSSWGSGSRIALLQRFRLGTIFHSCERMIGDQASLGGFERAGRFAEIGTG